MVFADVQSSVPPFGRALVMGLDAVQRVELVGQIRRVGVFLVGAVLVAALNGVSEGLLALLIIGTLYLIIFQLIASTIWRPSGADIFARLAVRRHAATVANLVITSPRVAMATGVEPPVVRSLQQATPSKTASASAVMARSSIWTSRRPIARITSLLLAVLNAAAGVALGVYLPHKFASTLEVFCAEDRGALRGNTLLILAVFAIFGLTFPLYARLRNAAAIQSMQGILATDLLQQLLALDQPDRRPERLAVAAEIRLLAGLLSNNLEQQIRSANELGETFSRDHTSWYRRLHLPVDIEMTLYQLLFVLGVWLGLLIPATISSCS